MSVFDLNTELESINAGCDRFNLDQIYPISGNPSNAYVGAGQAGGLTTFQFQDSVNWWSPTMSVFILQLQFVKITTPPTTVPIPIGDQIAYADNFVCTLFTQIKTQINSQQLDIVDVPWIIDTVLSYSNAKKNFLGTFASMSRLGEPLSTRLRNTTTNGGIVEVAFRPPVSLFDCKILPPGAQFRIDFNWASSAAFAFEALTTAMPATVGLATGNYNIQVNGFSMFKASMAPSKMINLPSRGVVDLNPCVTNQYFLNSAQQLKQNITLPPTANRVLVVIQDTNTAGPPVYGVGTGYNPATSFAYAVSNMANAPFAVPLQNIYLNLNELGVQMPNPIYQFSTISDWIRAYSDWCHICQGTAGQTEGSVPLGSFDITEGCTINYLNTTTLANSVFNAGDPNNPQQYYYSYAGAPPTVVPTATSFNQTARWGYLGRCPGPIIAFPVVRPENRPVSVGTLSLTFAAAVASASVTTLASYSMAIAFENHGGLYSYTLITGV
jgi:hypothetical protein